MNGKYVLPQAAQDTLGGIKAAEVEDKYTQECRIDKETGKIYTRSADRFLIEDTFEGNPIMSNSCREGNIHLIEGYGESTQFTTQGNQLFDINVYEGKSSAGAEATIDNGVIKIIGTPTKDTWVQSDPISIEDFKKYFKVGGLSIKPHKSSGCNFDFGIYINSTTVKENNSPYEITEEIYNNYSGNAYYFIDLKSSSAPSGYIQPMVYQTGSGEYEPYTGGAPSPSPEYPQEIKSSTVTGVKVTGKNLFDHKKLSGGEIVEFNGVQCYKYLDNGKNFTFDFTENKTENLCLTIVIYRDSEYADKKITIFLEYNDGTRQSNILTSGVIYTIETKEGKILKKIVGNEGWAQNVYIDLSITQLECGTTATPYEPYKEKTIPLSAPITLRGIPSENGNITIDGTKYLSDYIGQKEGVYGVFRKNGVFTIDSKNYEKMSFFRSQNGSNVYALYNIVPPDSQIYNSSDILSQKNVICNAFIGKTLASLTIGNFSIHLLLNVNFVTIGLSESIETVEGAKGIIKTLEDNGTPITIQYILANETFEALPEGDQQALKDLKTFYPTSIISWETEDGLSIWGKAILKQDMKLYIQNKIKELSNNSVKQIQNINRALLK